MFARIAQIFVAVLLLTLMGVAVWNCRGEQSHRKRLQVDSTRLESKLVASGVIINKLQNQANTAVMFAGTYKRQRDSAIAMSDASTGKLTYSEKVVAYLRQLVANKTLPATAVVDPAPPDLNREDVLTAGLKTANREEIERKRADSLYESIGARDAKILALQGSNIVLKQGVVAIKARAVENSRGGFLFFGGKARRQAKEIVKQADSALEESELEKEVNRVRQ